MRPENMKLVVLVNEGSASASEIVSGAVQDLDAGVIMGQDRTYGKGLVQKITPLKYSAALKYTVAKYYTPSGRCIQAVNYSGGREDKGKQLNSMPKIIDVISNPANEDVKEEGEGESEGDEEEEEIMMTLQDRADGASTVKDSERKQFYTKSGRSIRDGGGIEPGTWICRGYVACLKGYLSFLFLSCSNTTGALGSPGLCLVPSCSIITITITILLHITIVLTMA